MVSNGTTRKPPERPEKISYDPPIRTCPAPKRGIRPAGGGPRHLHGGVHAQASSHRRTDDGGGDRDGRRGRRGAGRILRVVRGSGRRGFGGRVGRHQAKGGGLGGGARVTGGLKAIGLTADQRLVVFRVDQPGPVVPLGKVDGLKGDTRLIGIDYRVQNGKLYGVGDAGGIYTIREVGRQGHQGLPAHGRPAGHGVRRRLQPRRQPPPGDQRHRPEPPPQPRRPPGRPPPAPRPSTAPSPTRRSRPHGRCHRAAGDRGGVHEQRPRRHHRDHPVRPRHRPGPGRPSSPRPTRATSPPPASSASTCAPNAGFDIYGSAKSGVNTGYAVTGARRLRRRPADGEGERDGELPEGATGGGPGDPAAAGLTEQRG